MPPLLLAVVAFLLALLVPAQPASAHAALLGANPAPGSIVGSSPSEIIVTFSEAITPVPDRVQVLAPDGKRISGIAAAVGSQLRIPVRRADQPLGTYLVSFRVISADTHPVGGAITFSVGAPSASPPKDTQTGTHTSVKIATPILHFLGYAGLILTVGPVLFLALLWPRRRSRRAASRLSYVGLTLIALATVGSLSTQAPAASGSALWNVSPTELGDVLTSSYGLTLLARLAILLLVGALLPPVLRGAGTRARTAILVPLALAGLTTWPLTGHAGAAPLTGVIVAADVVHVAAMAVWLGGLTTLTGFLLRGTHARVLAVILPVWSRWAALAVVWLIAGGTVQAVVQVGSIGSLWHTDYGRLLLAKIAVLAVTLGAAAFARRLVRRAQVSTAGVGQLHRTVGIEVVATAVVLGLSAVLVQVNPGRNAVLEQGAVREAGVSQTLTCSLYTLQFNIYPVEIGENNTIHAFVYTPAGAPLPAQQWTVTAQLLGQNLEPVSTPLLPLIPRHHAAGAITFPLAGTYKITFIVRISEIDQAQVETTITVPANSPAKLTPR